MENSYMVARPYTSITIRRTDVAKVHDYARANCDLRDYLMIRIPLKIGIRTGELCTLRLEEIDYETRTFQCHDSKGHGTFPLPLDFLSLQLIQDLAASRKEGYVFRQKHSYAKQKAGIPILPQTIDHLYHTIGKTVGIEKFSPRTSRHYFAADWHYIQHKSIELLRRILRHRSLAYTQLYLSRLVFWEDLQREYDSIRAAPFIDEDFAGLHKYDVEAHTSPMLSDFYKRVCQNCESEQVCKFIDQMPPFSTGCAYFKPKIQVPQERSRDTRSNL
jgi:integrase